MISVAISKGHKDLVEYLLDSEVDVNSSLKDGTTPLMVAVAYNKVDIAKYIIDKGADVNQVTTGEGNSALQYAGKVGNEELIEMLLEAGATGNKENDAALVCAASKGNFEMVRSLLDVRANVNSRRENGYTALRLARGPRKLDIMKLLLEKGADPNIKDEVGCMTALQDARMSGNRKLAELLLEAGAKEYLNPDSLRKWNKEYPLDG